MSKVFLAAAVLLSLCLTSCALFRADTEIADTVGETTVTVPDTDSGHAASGAENTAAPDTEATLSAAIALYDDLEENGVYTRLDTWEVAWEVGVDIAVFDVIPTDAPSLEYAGAYRELWQEAAAGSDVHPSLLLEYTADGRSYSERIDSSEDAQRVTDEGYLEVYLYDDVHQTPGAWYSHLTAADTTADTVITSVKLTGGARVESLESIRLTACIGDASGGTVTLSRAD